jgi:hypothetical protein
MSEAKKQDLLITEDTGAASQPNSTTLSIYSDKDVVFVPPMYIIHTAQQRSLTLKVNLS